MNVEVGERQAAADLDVVVEYGVSVPELAAAVRARVGTAVGSMTGLEVVEVNLRIVDVHLPQDDIPPDGGGRRVV
ncbi:Asp23/Gls24 family envelope stress response protein [Kitasatospora sp. NPDC059571]|uniref:Asp23/Gls24 family envelope stress response protein n=1 Tax=Kitasatospora sp. NPDC059571 TaxID=3346871 RepID=UPI003696790C